MEKGFYLFMSGKDYFFKSDKQKKCKSVAEAFLKKLDIPVTEDNIAYIIYNITPAVLEYKQYGVNIYGLNFGGYGDERTVIF